MVDSARRVPGLLSLLAVAMAAPAVLLSQSQQRPTFRAGVHYVTVDVVVTDRDGQPVIDLEADDFRIVEDGRNQPIVDFERVLVPLGTRAIDLTKTPAPPADVADNVPPPSTSRAIVIVIDDLSLRTADIIPIQRVLTSFLSRLSPDDSVAVIYPTRSDLGQDFTHDIGKLTVAVNNVRAALPGNPTPYALTYVLRSVVTSLADAPQGRKAIFFVSSGHDFDFGGLLNSVDLSSAAPRTGVMGPVTNASTVDTAYRLLDIFERAERQHTPIYAIDPHGLASAESWSNIGAIGSPQTRVTIERGLGRQRDFMHILANNTGGRAFVNQSNLPWAVDQIMIENGSYYLLGYYPDPYEPDGKFHRLDVRVNRPDVRVLARRGYMAPTVEDMEKAARPTPIDMLGAGLPGGDLMLRAFAAPVAASRLGAEAWMTVEVTYPDAAGRRGVTEDRLDLAWVAIDSDGRIRSSGDRSLSVSLREAGESAFTLALNDVIDLRAEELTIRASVVSTGLGLRGTVHLPLNVPKLHDVDLAVTPMVLAESGPTGVRVARLSDAASAFPFQPTVSRTFGADQGLALFSRVFAHSFDDISAELRVRRGETLVRAIPMQLAAQEAPGVREIRAIVALAGLAPGEYVLELVVRAAENRVERSAVPLRVR